MNTDLPEPVAAEIEDITGIPAGLIWSASITENELTVELHPTHLTDEQMMALLTVSFQTSIGSFEPPRPTSTDRDA